MLAQDPPPRTPLPGKRFRPPTLNISQAVERRSSVQLEIGPTPIKRRPLDDDEDSDDSDNDVFEDTLQLSSPDSVDGGPIVAAFKGVAARPEIDQELADLEALRKSVKENLKLRPIRSRTNLQIDAQAVPAEKPPPLPQPPDSASSTGSWADNPPESALSELYFTPSETPHASWPTSSSNGVRPPFSATVRAEDPSTKTIANATRPPPKPISARSLYDRLRSSQRPLLIDARSLAAHEAFHIRTSINVAIPSLILKRCKKPGGGFQTLNTLRQYITTENGKSMWDHLVGQGGGPWDGDVVIYDDDMNVNDKNNVGSTAWAFIPVIAPLLSFGSVNYLEGGISSAGHDPDLQTLILTGDETTDPVSLGSELAQDHARRQPSPSPQQKNIRKKPSVALFQLDTQTTYRPRQLPEIEPSSTVSTKAPSPPPPAPSPLPMMPASSSSPSSSTMATVAASNHLGIDSSPSPPPSSLAGFRRPPPPRRPPGAPGLSRLATKSMERINTNVPKLSLRTKPLRSATLGPPSLSLQLPTLPSHLKLSHSNHSPIVYGPASAYPAESTRYMSPFRTPPESPGTPKGNNGSFNFVFDAAPSSKAASFSHHRPQQQLLGTQTQCLPDPPPTARPDAGFNLDGPPTTGEEDEAFPTFTVSTILPNFLYLGPELTTKEHVDELKGLGVKRIMNIAAECDDDQGLGLRQAFDKYLRIPMRDTVEEDNIARGVRVACDFLDDARLHSSPTYVHCKAGKSRSVTAVMAYLIHANRWTLSRAYAFVLERRKGISPNIGFVSELMNFEEQELGNKSVGVQPSVPSAGKGPDGQGGFASGIPSGENGSSTGGNSGGVRSHHGKLQRSRTHARDSLPPIGMDVLRDGTEPMSTGEIMDRVNGDSGQEVEIKDSSGRYRHARRAPVNESTLRPMRRVSKAGLESSGRYSTS